MTEQQADSNSNLESLKETWNQCKVTLRRLGQPTEELRIICEAVRDAIATDRMGTDPEFAKLINEEVAIGVMQKLCKTATFDQNVSIVARLSYLKREHLFFCTVVC